MTGPVSLPEFELVPTGLANGGEAVARHDGRAVFVAGGLPGERLRVRVTDDSKSSFWRARITEVIEPSDARLATPTCAASAAGAGCCDLAHVEAGYARELKAQVFADVLRRIGRMDDARIAQVWPVGDVAALGPGGVDTDTHYRLRTRLFVDAAGAAGLRVSGGADIITGVACVTPRAGLTDDVAGRTFTPGSELVAVLDADGARHLTELAPPAPVPTAGERDGRRGDRSRGGQTRRAHAQRDRRRRERPRVATVVDGGTTATHRIGDRVWQIPVTGFWQAHHRAPQVYGRTVADMLGAAGARGVLWDLYGGAGVLAAAALDSDASTRAFDAVHIVDSDVAAILAARVTLGDEPGVQAHMGEVFAAIGGLPAPDAVILDPPRTGAGPKVVAAIAAAAPSTVVHVGCDVGRFARDLTSWTEHGYDVREVRAFDAFPQTHHMEAIACLTRRDRRPTGE